VASSSHRGCDRSPIPPIIQGGMGVAVSSWHLARTVASAGQLGVVSGVALDLVVARRLQDGDPGGAIRRALAAFPAPEVAERVLAEHFRDGGREPNQPYDPLPRLSMSPKRAAQELAVVGNFAEVWLAKEGHDGMVGINYLEKVQMATPWAAYGAMLAGVDVVLMGAGIPREIPHLLDELAVHNTVDFPVDVLHAASGTHFVHLDPVDLLGTRLPPLPRPRFLAVISAHALASYLARDARIRPDGFVVEGPRAGGHNAPPRGTLVLDESGQPVFGPRDLADVPSVAAVGLPFWLAGSFDTPDALAAARAAGAVGVQVGTLFALSEDSGLTPELRAALLSELGAGTLTVRTDALASPTGFPFKVAQIPGTLSDPAVLEARPRLCDLGYLRTPRLRENGSIGYVCAAEPVSVHLRKGGRVEDTVGRVCLCNALTADIGLAQTRRDGYTEKPLLTLGAELGGARHLLELHPSGWTAHDALDWLLGPTTAAAEA
jgi:NAD(P)H-dependent flavin oxidoreductase YrpB (nitropropane dioxygenase family)